jgi:uncharacterized protein
LAKQFATNGFVLVVAAEDDRLETVAEPMRTTGADIRTARVDLATREGVEELHRSMLSTGRPVEHWEHWFNEAAAPQPQRRHAACDQAS